MTEELIINQLYLLPENLKQEVLHYICFLSEKTSKSNKIESGNKPVFGSAKNKYELSEDFDEPLEDFKEYME